MALELFEERAAEELPEPEVYSRDEIRLVGCGRASAVYHYVPEQYRGKYGSSWLLFR